MKSAIYCLSITPPSGGMALNLSFLDNDTRLAAVDAIKKARPEMSIDVPPSVEICRSAADAVSTIEFWHPKPKAPAETPLSLVQFRATREDDDVGDVYASADDEPVPGLRYAAGCAIAKLENGGYSLVVANGGWEDTDLAKLERILWATHYLSECAPGLLLSSEGDDSSFDDFVSAICDADLVEIDGDLLGIMFARKATWTLTEIETILRGPYRQLLKVYRDMDAERRTA